LIRQWLRNIRIEKGLTQKIVAERAGITQPSYHLIECGENNPSVDTARKIANILDFDWTQFFPDEKGE
jgi:transcriptional regulator with XRE-family HTH domain